MLQFLKQVVEDFEVTPGDNELIIDAIATTVELVNADGDAIDGQIDVHYIA